MTRAILALCAGGCAVAILGAVSVAVLQHGGIHALAFGLAAAVAGAWALSWLLTLYLAASTARCESSAHYADGAAVLQVARNRGPLLASLLRPHQFAVLCPASPRAWSPRHVVLGLQAMAGTLPVPVWARRAWHYTGHADRPGMCARWGARVVGRIAHTFCAASGRRSR